MTDQKQHPKTQLSLDRKKKKPPRRNKSFFPISHTSVGSPGDIGAHFYPRPIRQRTPRKLCSLVLPPPLISLFDSSANNSSAIDLGESISPNTTTTANITSSVSTFNANISDNCSIDGKSVMELSHAANTPSPHPRNSSGNLSVSGASVGGGGGSFKGSHHGSLLPPHFRVGMAPCDPLIVFDGKFVLVGTSDGRVAIYSIMDFERRVGVCAMSEDVEASERRRLAEWEEEDLMEQLQLQELEIGDEKKEKWKESSLHNQMGDSGNLDADATTHSHSQEIFVNEDNEWEIREHTLQRESAMESVAPVLVISLPNGGKYETDPKATKEVKITSKSGTIFHPPTIVSMCATPGIGTSLIQQHDVVQCPTLVGDNYHEPVLAVPTFGEELLGHVTVLTQEGEVHVLEFLHLRDRQNGKSHSQSHQDIASLVSNAKNASNSSTFSGEEETSSLNKMDSIEVNIVLTFRTGTLGATCICIHSVPLISSSSVPTHNQIRANKSENNLLLHAQQHRNHHTEKLQCFIGHETGILCAFEIYSNCIHPGVTKHHSSPKERLINGSNKDLGSSIARKPKFCVPSHVSTNSPVGKPMSSPHRDSSDPLHAVQTPFSSISGMRNARSQSSECHQPSSSPITPGPLSLSPRYTAANKSVSSSPSLALPRALFHQERKPTRDTVTPSNSFERKSLRRTFSEPMDPLMVRNSSDGGETSKVATVVLPAKAMLCWRGGTDIPIRSLSTTGIDQMSDSSLIKSSHRPSLLAVGVEQNESSNNGFDESLNGSSSDPKSSGAPHHRFLSPVISLEVINVTLAERFWNEMMQHTDDDNFSSEVKTFIPLGHCSVLPSPGMEIKDSWTRYSSKKGASNSSRDKLFGLLGSQRVSITDQICYFDGPTPCFASAATDGTVCIFHRTEDGSWGVIRDDNQIVFFQKCIGLGAIECFSSEFNSSHSPQYPTRYIACCLRGGNFYIIPVMENSTNFSLNNITLLPSHFDSIGEDDGAVRFVHNFASGMVQVTPWIENLSKVPLHYFAPCLALKSVVIMGWPGGTVDVYEVALEKDFTNDVIEVK